MKSDNLKSAIENTETSRLRITIQYLYNLYKLRKLPETI